MNGVWDLTILYPGFDTPEWNADTALLDTLAEKLGALAENAGKTEHRELLNGYLSIEKELQETVSRMDIYASLRYSADTGDTAAASMLGRIDDKVSGTAAAEAKLRRTISGYPELDAWSAPGGAFSEYAYLLRSMKQNSRYLLSDREETLFAKMNLSGASAWEDLQSSLTSTVRAEYRGEERTLSELRNLAYDPDPEVRREAYRAELVCCEKIKDSVAFALNSIKLQVISECGLRGYASPLDQALVQSRMKRETLDALLSAMREYLPVFHRYLRAKAKLLGGDGALAWYDMFAPVGSVDRKYTVEDAKAYLLDIFGKFDTELHDMVKTAFEENWIDFYPRAGKVGGAFDCGVPSAKQSRVLTNFDGSFSDVVTLAHELGHAFHDKQVFSHSILNQEYTMPVAETASTFNEVLVVSEAIAAAESTEEKLALMESQLSDACQIICDIYSRYLFETSVFENRPEEFMNADRLCELMKNAQREAYGTGLSEETLHPYMWLCKSHYYSGSLSFYNFPYAFGGLFARGLYAKYKQEGASFVPAYKELLHKTSVTDVEECASAAGIDLTDKAFWAAGLQSIADEIDEFCSLCEQKEKQA